MQVLCYGRVTHYPPKGKTQLQVLRVEPKGIGELQLAFDQLKAKLEQEGLFSEERKRPLPAFPERVGLVTSPTGAAIQDILKILRGTVEVVLRPARVQGEGSAHAIADGIRELNRMEDLDLLIVGRGGGSAEDLWAFNEEVVARAIFDSRLPIISAVGHERDWSISDFVADLRAPTPTKAAEIVLAQRQQTLDRFLVVLEDAAFTEPEEWLVDYQEKIEGYQGALLKGLQEPILNAAHRLRVLQGELAACSPESVILQQAERLRRFHQTLDAGMTRSLEQAASRFVALAGRLSALSPLAVLERGYSITFDRHGRILKRSREVQQGDIIETRLHRGKIISTVQETKE